MELLVVIINDESFLPDIISGFVEIGIKGATVIDSVGMGRIVAHEIPIFSGLQEAFGGGLGSGAHNKTILSVIESAELMEEAITMIKEICGSLDNPGTGLIFVLPVNRAAGIAKSFLDI